MTEILTQLKDLLQSASKKAIQSKKFINTLAQTCISSKIKCKDFRKLFKEYRPDVYDEDKAEELYEKYDDETYKSENTLSNMTDLKTIIDNYAEKISEDINDMIDNQNEHRFEQYLKLKKYFEEVEGWCKINHPTTYGRAIKSEHGNICDFEISENTIEYFRNKNFIVVYNTPNGKEMTKVFNFYTVWIKDPAIKTYDKIEFDPTFRNKNDLNLFTDYCSILSVPNLIMSPLDKVFEHIKSICGYDMGCYEYFLNYLAHLVQKPHERCNTAVVMYGEEGIGKNMILDLIARVMNERYYCESAEELDLFGQFAKGMYRKIIFCFNEASKDDTKSGDRNKYLNKLKHMTTSEKIRVEYKGKEVFQVDNYCRLFFPTNHTEPFPITRGARRWFYLKGSDKYISLPDKERGDHFTSLNKHFRDRNIIYSFAKFLKNKDIVNFNPTVFPKSEGLKQAMQVPLILRFINSEILTDNNLVNKKIQATTLLEKLIAYCKANNYSSYAYNSTTLGKELQIYIDKGCATKYRGARCFFYKFDKEKLKEYIVTNKFNLEEFFDVEEDEQDDDLIPNENKSAIENIINEIEELEKKLQKKRDTLLKLCNKTIIVETDPIDDGVGHVELAITQAKEQPQEVKKAKNFLFTLNLASDQKVDLSEVTKETLQRVNKIIVKNFDDYCEENLKSTVTTASSIITINYNIPLTNESSYFIKDRFLDLLHKDNYLDNVKYTHTDLVHVEFYNNDDVQCIGAITKKVEAKIQETFKTYKPKKLQLADFDDIFSL